jgi:four helix bundle protein
MGSFKRVEDMEIWKRGSRLAVDVYRLSQKKELEKDWALCNQIRKSAISIPSNIAEGYERDTPAEFAYFLRIAKGSCGELRTQLYIAQALGFFDKATTDEKISECIEISSMIHGLIDHLRKSDK